MIPQRNPMPPRHEHENRFIFPGRITPAMIVSTGLLRFRIDQFDLRSGGWPGGRRSIAGGRRLCVPDEVLGGVAEGAVEAELGPVEVGDGSEVVVVGLVE